MTVAGQFITRAAEDTFALGERVGREARGRTVLLLTGDLGAGKTVFAKGVAAGLGIDPRDVTSPTFTLINVYEGRLRLFHIDLYRLDHGACRELGLEEIFEEERAVTIIEWAERLDYSPPDATRVAIEYVTDTERRITIQHLPAGLDG
jgi:tRNA threonylcarbamoyladenosine biosynthesis protein TsaE